MSIQIRTSFLSNIKLGIIRVISPCLMFITFSLSATQILHADGSLYLIEDPSSCSASTISKSDLQVTYGYVCQLNIYKLNETLTSKQIAATYYVKGQWKASYSNGASGRYWRITSVPKPEQSFISYLDGQNIVPGAFPQTKLQQVTDQIYSLDYISNLSLNIAGSKTRTLKLKATMNLSTGLTQFTGNISIV